MFIKILSALIKVIYLIYLEISLTIKIISTVLYIHSKNVVYKAMNLENIHINETGDIFFTNFKNSIYFENLQSTQKSL